MKAFTRQWSEVTKSALGVALSALLVGLCFSAEAQQSVKVHKIGWLGIGTAASNTRYDEFRHALRDFGYVEGKNTVFEYRSADNKLDRLPSLAEELVRLNIDLIITRGTPEAIALKNATKTIPIVFYDVTDPVGAGLVDSLAKPGRNITGFSGIEAVLVGKRLELLKETIPKLSRVAVLWNSQDLSSVQQWKGSQLSANELGLQVHSMEVISADQYQGAFKEAAKVRNDGLVVIAGSLEDANRKLISDLATKTRMPTIYPRTEFVEAGGLMSYGRDRNESVKRVPAMIDKILKGANPSDIPVEQPKKFELMINLKTAKALGLTIPSVVLMRADKVVK
jgi:putative tryptophan/tyrosine transport system substrate-binding protein